MFFPIRSFCVMYANSPGVEFPKNHKKRREIWRRLFKFSIKREIRKFHVVVVQGRQRNVPISVVHALSCLILVSISVTENVSNCGVIISKSD